MASSSGTSSGKGKRVDLSIEEVEKYGSQKLSPKIHKILFFLKKHY